ncbi:MAG: hypothetical protein RLZZ338_1699 [Cyanobacteriota bacterium]|jgi:hypothetical protein
MEGNLTLTNYLINYTIATPQPVNLAQLPQLKIPQLTQTNLHAFPPTPLHQRLQIHRTR